jgi:3-methyl-2-oxobutanoate hydroxymethyltransferase
MNSVLEFKKMKIERRPITMVTCYDHATAKIVDESEVDVVLVGDSVAMVVHGHPSTLQADVPMMALHTAAVARGIKNKLIVADLPFPTFRRGPECAMEAVDALMKAGAHAVKLEGVDGHEEVVERIVGSGVPVMGHLGLTPQSVNGLGGFKVQGRDNEAARRLVAQAKRLEELGCFSLVLECIPSPLASEITRSLSIPVIGIGAGVEVDGQVLVFQDLFGMNPGFKPKFVRRFGDGHRAMLEALNGYHQQVLRKQFPSSEESYS